MIKLIKLELRRNNLTPYIWGSLGIFIFSLFVGISFIVLPKIELDNKDLLLFTNPDTLISFVSIVSMSCFAILSSIMYSKFCIQEYTGRKNVLLFTYPHKKSNILLAKIVLVSAFMGSSMIVSNTISLLIIGFIGNIFGNASFNINYLSTVVVLSVLLSMLSNLIGLVSLRVGFWKKSTIWTIVTAVVMISPLGNAVMLFNEYFIQLFLSIGFVMFIVCLFLFVSLFRKVNKMECL